MNFGTGSGYPVPATNHYAPDHARGAYSTSPDRLAIYRRHTSKGREGKEMGSTGRETEGRGKRRGGKVMERDGRNGRDPWKV